jgi:two-component system, NtrC family, C4-dicarboxylate transport sensor histidine kinase DctB
MYRFRDSSMNARLIILLFALPSVASIAGGGYLYYDSARQSALQEAEAEFTTKTRLLQQGVEELISFHYKDLRALAGFEELRPALANPNEESLRNANRVLDHFAEGLNFEVCYLLDSTGLTITSSNRNTRESFVGHNYFFRHYFRGAIEGNSATQMAVGVVTHRIGLFLGHPV